jgi:hypothetical protein
MKSFNTKQKVTVVVFLILGTILITNQLINNFNFTL